MSEHIETPALYGGKKAHSLQAQVSSASQSDPSMSDTSQADDIPHEVISSQSPTIYLKGARLHMITAAFETLIFLSLFITNLEIPIVTTSLVSITDDLNSFNQVNWIASAYMLGEVSMLMIWGKLSDIFGRKLCTVTSIGLFTIFAGACGSSQSMTQLIIFRAFQGIGSGGNFALGNVILFELVPKKLYTRYTSFISIVYSISFSLGPVLGGALNHSKTWRWVFLLNVPAGALSALVIVLYLPAKFPNHERDEASKGFGFRSMFSTNVFKRVDLLGAVILLVAIALLVTALEEAGQLYDWKSAFVIALLTVSCISWVGFVFWERLVSLESQTAEPVFPWRLMTSRIWIGMILNAVFLGIPYFVTIFQLPQRFQVVDNTTALNAAFRLIPFTLLCPVGSIVSTVVAGKAKVPPIFLIMIGSGLQIVGFALLSTLTVSEVTPVSQYGFQIIAGFGVGINLSTLLLITPYSISEPADKAVAVSSITQFRILGGVLGIAIATAAYKSNIISNLDKILTKEQRSLILESTSMIKTFNPKVQMQIREVFAEGYNLQFRILVAFAAAQIPSSLLMWQEKQIVV
ncbi:putative efflux pump antibiotic resistance protein [Botrytis fragariae]|uniref:Putative efflux pump antibiotic resistance protein n=1 Tax=Botrytis fragariae TaxID=1964551 RepID=A0A8H6AK50_9HELO|nr:putative efflux pump antibiotic resistance protein [Botrytis fragariae]KAF5868834.1 putative efflux pump antibiotic resistance protein [Botrytis fragariae]